MKKENTLQSLLHSVQLTDKLEIGDRSSLIGVAEGVFLHSPESRL